MASTAKTIDFILGQITQAGDVTARKMFGEYGIFCDHKMVAIVGDDQLFVKITAAGKTMVVGGQEASPYPGAKPCFLITDDKLDDREWLSRLIRITATELPMPKKKSLKPA